MDSSKIYQKFLMFTRQHNILYTIWYFNVRCGETFENFGRDSENSKPYIISFLRRMFSFVNKIVKTKLRYTIRTDGSNFVLLMVSQ